MRIIHRGKIRQFDPDFLRRFPAPESETADFVGPPHAGKSKAVGILSHYLHLKRIDHITAYEPRRRDLPLFPLKNARGIAIYKGLRSLTKVLAYTPTMLHPAEFKRDPSFQLYDCGPTYPIAHLGMLETYTGEKQRLKAYMQSIRPWMDLLHVVVVVKAKSQTLIERRTKMDLERLESFRQSLNYFPQRLAWTAQDMTHPLVLIEVDSTNRTPLQTAGVIMRAIGTTLRNYKTT